MVRKTRCLHVLQRWREKRHFGGTLPSNGLVFEIATHLGISIKTKTELASYKTAKKSCFWSENAAFCDNHLIIFLERNSSYQALRLLKFHCKAWKVRRWPSVRQQICTPQNVQSACHKDMKSSCIVFRSLLKRHYQPVFPQRKFCTEQMFVSVVSM